MLVIQIGRHEERRLGTISGLSFTFVVLNVMHVKGAWTRSPSKDISTDFN